MARGRGRGRRRRRRRSHETKIIMGEKMSAEQIDGEDSDLLMGGTGSILEADWVRSKNVKKDGGIDGRVVADGSSNAVGARDEENGAIVVHDADKRGKERMGVERWNGDKWEDDGIRVGDLVWVWGKYNKDLWWPGQVYDPRDASELVLRYRQEGCVLVVLFGNGSCCWSRPSDLMPFVENLDRMVHSDTSKDFVNAVQKAVHEMCRNVESKNTCRCIAVENRGRLSRPVSQYYAKEAGALIPPVEFDRLHIQEDESCGIRAKVHGFARTASFNSVLELHILKSWMSAYSYVRRGSGLCMYSDPTVIEGMEDKSAAVNAPFHGPDEDDHSSANVSSARSKIKIDERKQKKMKNVADLYLVEKKEREVKIGGLSSRKRA